MINFLPKISKILFATMLIALIGTSALAQTKSPRQSRLDIGKKPKPVVLTKAFIKYPLRSDFKLGEIRFKQPDVVNQYFKNLLLAPTAKAATTIKIAENNSVEASKHEANEKGDKLFANDRVVVSVAYPNPANESTSIDYHFLNQNAEAKVSLYSILASQVAEYQLDKSDKKLVIPTESLASGVYYYQLVIDGKMVNSKKIIIRH
jgi:Secretion system C-terminal sorting domain